MLFVYKFSYSIRSLPLSAVFVVVIVVPNSQLTIIEKKLFYIRVVDISTKNIHSNQIFRRQPLSINFIMWEWMRWKENMKEKERDGNVRTNDRMNGKIKLWIQMKYVLCFHCIDYWVSEWVSEYITVFTYLFIVSRVHCWFDFDFEFKALRSNVCLWIRCTFARVCACSAQFGVVYMFLCVNPLAFVYFYERCLWWDSNKYTNLLFLSVPLVCLPHSFFIVPFSHYCNMCTQYSSVCKAIETTSSPEIYIELSIRLVHT